MDGIFDIALVRFPKAVSENYLSVPHSPPPVGEKVTIVGFGGSHFAGSDGAKRYGESKIAAIDGSWQQQQQQQDGSSIRSAPDVLVLGDSLINSQDKISSSMSNSVNAANVQGDSGGPALFNGNVVGVASTVDNTRVGVLAGQYCSTTHHRDWMKSTGFDICGISQFCQKAPTSNEAARRQAALIRSDPTGSPHRVVTPPPANNPRQTTAPTLNMSFVPIPAGTFKMGSPGSEYGRYEDEGPDHWVTLSKGYEIQTTEVTQSQWVAVTGSNPSKFKQNKDCPDEFTTINNTPLCPNNPVEQVSWADVLVFIERLNNHGGVYRYRLPTEAEWEYAARGGEIGPYSTQGQVNDFAWFNENSAGRTHRVGQLMANPLGLHDVHGNVAEWTADRFGKYPSSSVTDPKGAGWGSVRVFRGGAWDSNKDRCRSSSRGGNDPGIRRENVGFRLVRTSL